MLSLEFDDNGDFVAGGLTFDRGDGVFFVYRCIRRPVYSTPNPRIYEESSCKGSGKQTE